MKMKKWKVSPIKTISVKPINILSKRSDLDRDGVPDRKDCMPINPWKQHIRPSKTMKKRLEHIPLYVTDRPMVDSKVESYHILEAKRHAPKAQKEMYAVIKKYPSVISEIERTQPKEMLYSSVTPDIEADEKGYLRTPLGMTIPKRKAIIVRPHPIVSGKPPSLQEREQAYEQFKIPERKREVLEKSIIENPYEEEPVQIQEKKKQAGIARTFFHELYHLQHGDVSKKEYKKYKKDIQSWEDTPYEKKAEEYAEQKLKEREEKGKEPTGKEITETLDLGQIERE